MAQRRFIEESFPIKEVSKEGAREKNIRHGHISTLHIWWARRPLATSRATIYASLTPAPKSEEEKQKKNNFIAELSKWENSNNEEFLEKAREELSKSTEEDRQMAEAKIADLEKQIAEAAEKEERAKSMAETTRRGHVYVISNIGSFGEDVFKIGLTRRLEPLDRVKELGDASVPFPFDVHAIIYAENAPALETDLHRRFTHKRVNAVNLRKEFFRVDLNSIKNAVEELAGSEADFKTTILAEEYHETRRLQELDTAVKV